MYVGNTKCEWMAATAAVAATATMEQAPTNAIVLRRIVKSNGCDLIKSSCAYFFFGFSGIGASVDHGTGKQKYASQTGYKQHWKRYFAMNIIEQEEMSSAFVCFRIGFCTVFICHAQKKISHCIFIEKTFIPLFVWCFQTIAQGLFHFRGSMLCTHIHHRYFNRRKHTAKIVRSNEEEKKNDTSENCFMSNAILNISISNLWFTLLRPFH